jgi:SAM-dependent methyltransferase
MRYYDQENQRLVYIEENATPEFWDRQWEDEKLKKSILAGAKERFVYPITRHYLKPESKILEGGCGKGQFVYSLHARGYDATGIDFAPKIVEKAKSVVPELKLFIGDVRKLEFADNSFDGYWSLGVIEHFPEGYETIGREMHRVLKPGGYLFLTFPYMSPLRRLKAWLGLYPKHDSGNFDHDRFYQFALSSESVMQNFTNWGFELVKKKPYEGFKGFKDESGPLKPFFQSIYNNKGLPVQYITYILSSILSPFTSHTILLVFRNKAYKV